MRLCAFAIRTAMLSGLRGMDRQDAQTQAWAEARFGPGVESSAALEEFHAVLIKSAKLILDAETKIALMAAPRRARMDEEAEGGGVASASRPKPIGPKS